MSISSSVAVIDLGSNSIKALVASVEPESIRPLFSATRETRVGAGMAKSPALLSLEAMEHATESVASLLEEIKTFNPAKILIAATSAVREAQNGSELARMVEARTGHPLVILSGEDEALGIAEGVITDPLVSRLPCFSAFDLGGGSLECIRIEGGRLVKALSVPLGAVRLTERWVPDSKEPLTSESLHAIQADVEATLRASGFPLTPGPMVGTSGAFTISRSILAYRLGRPFGDVVPVLQIPYLKALFHEISSVPAAQRLKVPKLPPSRVDIFPTALATVLAIADLLGAEEVFHSQRNLRFGLAEQLAASLRRPPQN